MFGRGGILLKVKELIEELKKCSQDKEVIIEFDLGYGKAECDEVIELEDKVVISEKI